MLDVTGNLPFWPVYFFPVRSIVLRKKILVSYECVDGGNWSCSGSGSDWIIFSCVDLRPVRGCWRCPSMVDCFLGKYLCTRSNDRPGQEVKKFLWFIFPIQNEWGSIRMRGDNPPMLFLTCTRRRSPQNIRQESWTTSLVYFAGSNLTCTGLCVGRVYLSL